MDKIVDIKFEKNEEEIEGIVVTFLKGNQHYKKRISLYNPKLQEMVNQYKDTLSKDLKIYYNKNKLYHILDIVCKISGGLTAIVFFGTLIAMLLIFKPSSLILLPLVSTILSYIFKEVRLDEEALEKEDNIRKKIQELDLDMNNLSLIKTQFNEMKEDYYEEERSNDKLNVIFDELLKIANKGEQLVLKSKSYVGRVVTNVMEEIAEEQRFEEESRKREEQRLSHERYNQRKKDFYERERRKRRAHELKYQKQLDRLDRIGMDSFEDNDYSSKGRGRR